MVQWYAFALLAACLWLWFHRPRAVACRMTDGRDRRATPRRAGDVAAAAQRRTLLLIAAVTLAPIVASYTIVLFFSARARGELRNAAADGADSRHRRDAAGRIAVPPRRIARALGAASRWRAAIATPAASAGSTPHGRRERCRARSRIASCGCCCRRRRRAFRRVARATPGARRRSRPGRRGGASSRHDARSLYLVDPARQSGPCAIPDDPDIKGIARDLTRLLQASRIG